MSEVISRTRTRVLVAYASKTGTAREAAERVAEAFRGAGDEVDVSPAGKVKGLTLYDGIVLGTAIRAGKPLKEARDFVRQHAEALAHTRTALFSVGTMMVADTPERRVKALSFLAGLVDVMAPVSVGVFQGRVDRDYKVPLMYRRYWTITLKDPDSDVALAARTPIDWEPLEEWAREIVPQIA